MATFSTGARVVIHGTSKPELNGQVGIVQSYNSENLRFSVLVGQLSRVVALKEVNLKAATPWAAVQGMVEQVKAKGVVGFGKEKFGFLQTEFSSMAEAEARHFGASQSTFLVASLVLFLMFYFTYGFIRAPILVYIVYSGFRIVFPTILSNVQGDKLELLKTTGTKLNDTVGVMIDQRVKTAGFLNRPTGLVGTEKMVATALVYAILALLFYPGGSSTIDMPHFDPLSGLKSDEANYKFYMQGFEDGNLGIKKTFDEFISEGKAELNSLGDDQYADYPEGGQVEGASTGFGFGKLIPIAVAGRFIYTLGQSPNGWDKDVAMANFQNMELWKKAFLVFGLSRIFF